MTWLSPESALGGEIHLLDRPPVIGATYSLLVRHPFRGRIGQAQWVLFEPAGPWRDGWSGHPRRLPELGLARIEPTGFMGQRNLRGSAEEQTGWLTARVEELVLAPDITRAFTTVRSGPLGPALSSPWPAGECVVVEHGSLTLVERAITPELGMWALLHRSALGRPALLALGEWGFHEANVHAGHRPLQPHEAARIIPPR